MAFHIRNCVGTRDDRSFAVQWLACALPCRRFAGALADVCARFGADVGRYSFTVRDLHPLLLAGLPAHSETLPVSGRSLNRIGTARFDPAFCVKEHIEYRKFIAAASSPIPRLAHSVTFGGEYAVAGLACPAPSVARMLRSGPPLAPTR